MREVCLGVVMSCVALAGIGGQERVPSRALREARDALGGAALDDVRTLQIVGRSSRDLGPMRLSSDVEMRVAFPDRYVRIDRLNLGGATSEMVAGFNGATPVRRASGPGGARIDPAALLPEPARATAMHAAAAALRQDLALLMLGMFAASFDAFPLQFIDEGIAESPEGRADVVSVSGPESFAARLFIDAGTRLPLMVGWLAPDVGATIRTLVAGGPGSSPAPLTPEAVLAQVQPAVEHRLHFADFRPVGSRRWPFRVRRSIGGTVVEELLVGAFTVNPGLPPDAFDPQP